MNSALETALDLSELSEALAEIERNIQEFTRQYWDGRRQNDFAGARKAQTSLEEPQADKETVKQDYVTVTMQ